MCPQAGELHFFGYSPLPPFLTYHVLDAEGNPTTIEFLHISPASNGSPTRLVGLVQNPVTLSTSVAGVQHLLKWNFAAEPNLSASLTKGVTLIATGGLRTPSDFIKALCLGADGVALANSAMQAIGCVAARICNTNNCPAGIATQQESLRSRVDVQGSAERLERFLSASVELMQVMARACGHSHLNQSCIDDLSTWKRGISELTGVAFAGVAPR